MFGDGGSSGNCGPVAHTYTQTGCFDVTLTVTLNGCANTQTFPDLVCLISNPIADFSYSPELAQEYNPEYQFDNNSVNAYSYHWSFGDGGSSTEENPTHVYPSSIAEYDVCLDVTNEYGCPDTLCKTVSIAEGLVYYIPNSFTPDGDEFNNLFHPVFTAGFDPYDFEFYIYDRWGELIWESHDASAGWDGTYNDQPVKEGTYVWKVYFKRSSNDEKFTRTGHVNVLR